MIDPLSAIEDLCNQAGAPQNRNGDRGPERMTVDERVAWMVMQLRKTEEKLKFYRCTAEAGDLVNEKREVTRQSILEEAIKCVTKDRNATHGDPEDNFNCIAEAWNWWLKHRKPSELGPVDVAVMMDLMKTARIVTSPEHPDHWIDKCGYSACGGGIACKKTVKSPEVICDYCKLAILGSIYQGTGGNFHGSCWEKHSKGEVTRPKFAECSEPAPGATPMPVCQACGDPACPNPDMRSMDTIP